MDLKKIVAAFAVSGALVTMGVGTSGTAWASPREGNPAVAVAGQDTQPAGGWILYGVYETQAQCNAVGIGLVAEGAFGGPYIDYICLNFGGGWYLYANRR